MDLLIADSAQRDHYHVEAVKPRPMLNVMKAGRACRSQHQQGNGEESQCGKSFQQSPPDGAIVKENLVIGEIGKWVIETLELRLYHFIGPTTFPKLRH